MWKHGGAAVCHNPLLLDVEAFTGVCSTRNVFTHLGRNWPCCNISSSFCFLPSLDCLLHVLLRPEFSLGSVWQEEGEREILDVKEAPR